MRAMRLHHESPSEANFYHLVLDIAWFGLALASTNRFLSVYAIRLDATEIHLAIMASLPAIFLLLGSAIAPYYRARYTNIVAASYWPGMVFRGIFLLPAFTPLLPTFAQPWWLVLSVVLPAVHQGISSSIFLKLLREAVPPDKVTALVSGRAVALNICLMIGALGFGFWLEETPFPYNYQAMFVLAFVLTMISLSHVMQVKPLDTLATAYEKPANPLRAWLHPGFVQVALMVVVAYVAFHSIFAVIPMRVVKELGATEGFMAIYSFTELAGAAGVAAIAAHLVAKVGSRQLIALGLFGTGLSALVNALSPVKEYTLIAALLTGACWTAVDIALFSYLSERTPNESIYSTAYYQVISVSLFVGPLISMAVSGAGLPLGAILLVGAVLRMVASVLALLSPRMSGPIVRTTQSWRPSDLAVHQ